MCVLASRIARARPSTVTILAPVPMFERMEKEVAHQFGEHEADYHARVRCVSGTMIAGHANRTTIHSLIAISSNAENLMDFEHLNASFAKSYLDLVEERPLICMKSEKEHVLPKPDVVVIDVSCSKSLSGMFAQSS